MILLNLGFLLKVTESEKYFFLNLSFLLKVGQMKVCQNPSFISTLLKNNRQTKVKCILSVKMVQNQISEKDSTLNPFFHSRQKKNLEDHKEIIDEMEQEIIDKMENFNQRGSNWVFQRVIQLEVHFVRWKPLKGASWIPLPPKLANKKSDYQHQKQG